MLASTAVVFSMDAAGVSAVSPVDGDDTGGVPLAYSLAPTAALQEVTGGATDSVPVHASVPANSRVRAALEALALSDEATQAGLISIIQLFDTDDTADVPARLSALVESATGADKETLSGALPSILSGLAVPTTSIDALAGDEEDEATDASMAAMVASVMLSPHRRGASGDHGDVADNARERILSTAVEGGTDEEDNDDDGAAAAEHGGAAAMADMVVSSTVLTDALPVVATPTLLASAVVDNRHNDVTHRDTGSAVGMGAPTIAEDGDEDSESENDADHRDGETAVPAVSTVTPTATE